MARRKKSGPSGGAVGFGALILIGLLTSIPKAVWICEPPSRSKAGVGLGEGSQCENRHMNDVKKKGNFRQFKM